MRICQNPYAWLNHALRRDLLNGRVYEARRLAEALMRLQGVWHPISAERAVESCERSLRSER